MKVDRACINTDVDAQVSDEQKLRLLKAFERKISDLPMLPSVVARFVSMNPNADDYFEKVRGLASEDPPFAVRLIQLANSPAYSPVKPITTIAAAITRIGVNAVAGLVTSMAVMRVFVPTHEGQKKLWVHSIEVAVGARMIANLLDERGLADTAYLVGLMHDIGRFIMFEQTSDALNKVEETHWQTVDALLQAELDVFRFSHSELGFLACSKWHFPELIADVVRYHHNRFELHESGLSKDTERLLFFVQLSDLLSVSLLGRDDYQEMDQAAMEAVVSEHCIRPEWQALSLSATALARLSKKVRAESHQMAESLGVL